MKTALGLISAYRVGLSPLMASLGGGACRFVPSCSEYARQAILQHGVPRGSWLALKRLSRCHPFGPFGHDPLPGHSDASSAPRRS